MKLCIIGTTSQLCLCWSNQHNFKIRNKYNYHFSSVAKHIVDDQHNFKIDNLSIVQNEQKGLSLNLLGSYEITKFQRQVVKLIIDKLYLI